jgi:hypothetical protein
MTVIVPMDVYWTQYLALLLLGMSMLITTKPSGSPPSQSNFQRPPSGFTAEPGGEMSGRA